MRPTIAVATVLVLFLSGGAEGANLIQLAETGGFLLGNAYRCGVPTDRLEHAGQVIHAMIAAVSSDSGEEAAADSRFAQIFTANTFPDRGQDALIPPCKTVIAQFERLERHHQQIGTTRSTTTTP
jgi:hypothetical protein